MKSILLEKNSCASLVVIFQLAYDGSSKSVLRAVLVLSFSGCMLSYNAIKKCEVKASAILFLLPSLGKNSRPN